MDELVNQLIGIWHSDPRDIHSLESYGRVTLNFTKDRQLVYTIHADGKNEIILLNYRVEGQFLVTDQPSQPSEERTRFSITPDGNLILHYEEHESTYIRD